MCALDKTFVVFREYKQMGVDTIVCMTASTVFIICPHKHYKSRMDFITLLNWIT